MFAESDVNQLISDQELGLSQHYSISRQEVEWALKRLKTGKACGADLLKDHQLKLALKDDEVLDKITRSFNQWTQRGQIPHYLKSTVIVPLSKTDDNLPPRGKIRPIAIALCLFKVFEHITNARIKSQLEQPQLQLHPG